MKTTVKAFLHWQKKDWEENGRYVPDGFDPTPQQIAALKAKKQEILANAHVQAENIEEQIQRLLSIEYKPEAE